MSSASTDIILDNVLNDGSQGQERPSPQDTVSDKADQEGAMKDVNVNTWADFWYNIIGVNVIPTVSKDKRPNLASWKEWQTNPVTEEQHDNWKRDGRFNQGMAVIAGQIWRGPNKGKHLVCVDCDNQAGIDEFLSHCLPKMKSREELSQATIVEQHLDNREKAHIYLIMESPLKNRPGLNSTKEKKGDGIPIIEIKSEGKSYVICSPSVHKDGHRYEITGTKEPEVLDQKASDSLQRSINQVYEKFGEKSTGKSNNGKPPMDELLKGDYVANEGRRHPDLLRVIDHYILKHKDTMSEEHIKELGYEWNRKHCNPPLDDTEVEGQWESSKGFVARIETTGLPSHMEDGLIKKTINTSPPVFYYADLAGKKIGLGHIDYEENEGTGKKEQKTKLSSIIIDAIPHKILIYKKNPLLNQSLERVKITFRSKIEKEFEAGPCDNTKDLIQCLDNKHLIINTTKANEALSCIINAYKENEMVEYSDDITTGGYYLINGKLNTVNTTQSMGAELSKKQVSQCIQFLNHLASNGWKNKNIFPTVLKWGLVSPFGFSIKFNSGGFFPWLQMYGRGQSGKTTLGELVLSIWDFDRKDKSVGFNNIDSVARFGYTVSKDTYPILVNEVGSLFTNSYGRYTPILELIKHSIESTTCRGKFFEGKHYQEILALSPMMLTSNLGPPNDGSYNRRFMSIHFPVEEKKEMEEQKVFNRLLSENRQSLSVLGDFVSQYVSDNPLLLINKRWDEVARDMLSEFYRYAECPTPEWIDYLEEQRDAIDESSEKTFFDLRAFLIIKINDAYSRHRRMDYTAAEIDISSKLDHCLKNKLVPFMSEVGEDTIIITVDIIKELKNNNQAIENLTGLKDVGAQLDFNYANKNVNGRRMRVLEGKREVFLGFINAEMT